MTPHDRPSAYRYRRRRSGRVGGGASASPRRPSHHHLRAFRRTKTARLRPDPAADRADGAPPSRPVRRNPVARGADRPSVRGRCPERAHRPRRPLWRSARRPLRAGGASGGAVRRVASRGHARRHRHRDRGGDRRYRGRRRTRRAAGRRRKANRVVRSGGRRFGNALDLAPAGGRCVRAAAAELWRVLGLARLAARVRPACVAANATTEPA